MLVHPNPMIQLSPGNWEDTKTQRVYVKPTRAYTTRNPLRWTVYERRGRSNALSYVSSHIMESAAVVAAQALANRIYRKSLRSKRINEGLLNLDISDDQKKTLRAQLTDLLKDTSAESTGLAQEKAREMIKHLKILFKL